MKYPSSVCILGKWHKVVYEDTIESEEGILEGLYCQSKSIIRVRKGQTDEEVKRTIIHEIAHGLLRRSALHEIIGDRAEEALCQILENLADYVTWNYKSDVIKYKQNK